MGLLLNPMINLYATADDLALFLNPTYTVDEDDAGRLLQRASEVIAEVTFGRSEERWFATGESIEGDQYTDALRDATCAQVEFWLEVGEEFDISNARGSIAISRVQISRLPPKLSLRAYRFLRVVGLVTPLVEYAT